MENKAKKRVIIPIISVDYLHGLIRVHNRDISTLEYIDIYNLLKENPSFKEMVVEYQPHVNYSEYKYMELVE